MCQDRTCQECLVVDYIKNVMKNKDETIKELKKVSLKNSINICLDKTPIYIDLIQDNIFNFVYEDNEYEDENRDKAIKFYSFDSFKNYYVSKVWDDNFDDDFFYPLKYVKYIDLFHKFYNMYPFRYYQDKYYRYYEIKETNENIEVLNYLTNKIKELKEEYEEEKEDLKNELKRLSKLEYKNSNKWEIETYGESLYDERYRIEKLCYENNISFIIIKDIKICQLKLYSDSTYIDSKPRKFYSPYKNRYYFDNIYTLVRIYDKHNIKITDIDTYDIDNIIYTSYFDEYDLTHDTNTTKDIKKIARYYCK